ncbi:MAG: macro domain-containing protein [Oscillospiraceae bacterium]|nr:macro domain-containing protein [Oscillospiraceae bacterium]
MPFQIIRHDITKVTADGIVNSANPRPIYASGTDSAIYKAAGAEQLLAERKKIGDIAVGDVAVTPAFNLKARYIFHTVGPVWYGGGNGELDALASCYRKTLSKAVELGCESIAFPLISTGVYGFPKDKALDIALREISSFLEDHEMEVTLVVLDRSSFELSKELVEEVKQYITEHYVAEQTREEYGYHGYSQRERERLEKDRSWRERRRREAAVYESVSEEKAEGPYTEIPVGAPVSSERERRPQHIVHSSIAPKQSLEELMRNREDGFQPTLFRLIDERGMTDPQVYHRANLDRKLFSKIRKDRNYNPKKSTVIALAFALKLNIDETTDLLRRAGYALSPGNLSDIIVEYFIRSGEYDLFKVNAYLFDQDLPAIGY